MRLMIILFLPILYYGCNTSDQTVIDTIFYNAEIYTASDNSTATAIAITNDTIAAIGLDEDILALSSSTTNQIDVKGQFMMPGFIDSHGHFLGLGQSVLNLNFIKDTSWQAIVKKVEEKVKTTEPGEWIYGRGWHQEKWSIQPDSYHDGYPIHHELSQISPENPVLLVHASGHSLYANQKAMDISGVNIETADPSGGKIIKKNKLPIGVFEENAMLNIAQSYNKYRAELDQTKVTAEWYAAIRAAQKECLQKGVTSFQDAGSSFSDIEKYEDLALKDSLDIRLWAMLRHSSEEMDGKLKGVKKVGVGHNHFTCRALKTEVDGALGAHGAWLLAPYDDKANFIGQNTTDIAEVQRIAQMADEHDMQLCVHAIGDRANKEVLDIIASYHDASSNKRWRVEHAQHLNPTDIQRFAETGAIASMQTIHCTSDAPFVVKRLGVLRAKIGAYAWKALLQAGVTIINGTDTPVEDVDPLENFYAAVTRTRQDNGMQFFVENKMSREEALKSYTLDAAYGAFEEDIKGSLETGKLADIVILDHNLLTCGDMEILDTKVVMTMVGGEVKYQK